jgi:hypothetical protein
VDSFIPNLSSLLESVESLEELANLSRMVSISESWRLAKVYFSVYHSIQVGRVHIKLFNPESLMSSYSKESSNACHSHDWGKGFVVVLPLLLGIFLSN